MKKYIVFFILLVLYLSIKEPTEHTVFNDINNLDSCYIETNNLNTNNLSCIDKLNIISLEININPVYKIDNVFFYKNTSIFIKNVMDRLKEKGYYREANKYLISPIYIKKILVYNINSKIIDVLNKCNIKYNTCVN